MTPKLAEWHPYPQRRRRRSDPHAATLPRARLKEARADEEGTKWVLTPESREFSPRKSTLWLAARHQGGSLASAASPFSSLPRTSPAKAPHRPYVAAVGRCPPQRHRERSPSGRDPGRQNADQDTEPPVLDTPRSKTEQDFVRCRSSAFRSLVLSPQTTKRNFVSLRHRNSNFSKLQFRQVRKEGGKSSTRCVRKPSFGCRTVRLHQEADRACIHGKMEKGGNYERST